MIVKKSDCSALRSSDQRDIGPVLGGKIVIIMAVKTKIMARAAAPITKVLGDRWKIRLHRGWINEILVFRCLLKLLFLRICWKPLALCFFFHSRPLGNGSVPEKMFTIPGWALIVRTCRRFFLNTLPASGIWLPWLK